MIYGMMRITTVLFSKILSLPSISMSFISFHDYMYIYSHDYYVLKLSFLYCMIKNMGRYLDEMMKKWLHWLYDFT
jgi:hypothetical protein